MAKREDLNKERSIVCHFKLIIHTWCVNRRDHCAVCEFVESKMQH